MEKKSKFWYRPQRVQFFLVDDFTGEQAMILESGYDPIRDGLNGQLRKMVTKMVKGYKYERLLFSHNPKRFPSTQHLKIVKIY